MEKEEQQEQPQQLVSDSNVSLLDSTADADTTQQEQHSAADSTTPTSSFLVLNSSDTAATPQKPDSVNDETGSTLDVSFSHLNFSPSPRRQRRSGSQQSSDVIRVDITAIAAEGDTTQEAVQRDGEELQQTAEELRREVAELQRHRLQLLQEISELMQAKEAMQGKLSSTLTAEVAASQPDREGEQLLAPSEQDDCGEQLMSVFTHAMQQYEQETERLLQRFMHRPAGEQQQQQSATSLQRLDHTMLAEELSAAQPEPPAARSPSPSPLPIDHTASVLLIPPSLRTPSLSSPSPAVEEEEEAEMDVFMDDDDGDGGWSSVRIDPNELFDGLSPPPPPPSLAASSRPSASTSVSSSARPSPPGSPLQSPSSLDPPLGFHAERKRRLVESQRASLSAFAGLSFDSINIGRLRDITNGTKDGRQQRDRGRRRSSTAATGGDSKY